MQALVRPCGCVRAAVVVIVMCMCIISSDGSGPILKVEDPASTAAKTSADSVEQPQSLNELLKWAVAHSDEESRAKYAAQADSDAAARRRAEIMEVMKHLEEIAPDPAKLVRHEVAALQRSGASARERTKALFALQKLVEPIDVANDLHTLGGAVPVIEALTSSESEDVDENVVAAAAFVIGTGASNNEKFQQLMLKLGAGGVLVDALRRATSASSQRKLLFAVDRVLLDTDQGRKLLYEKQGIKALSLILKNAASLGVKKKVLFCLSNLWQSDPQCPLRKQPVAEDIAKGLASSISTEELKDSDTAEKVAALLTQLWHAEQCPTCRTHLSPIRNMLQARADAEEDAEEKAFLAGLLAGVA